MTTKITKTKKAVNEDVMHLMEEGTPFIFGGVEYIIPPLPITVLHKTGFYSIQSKIQEHSKNNDLEALGESTSQILDFVFSAIQRNYPNATREKTVELVTMAKLKQLLPCLVDIPEGIKLAKND